ncbi:FMN-binding negative transcriptional regulator [Usitatibacter palustris]|uniref:Protease synthase and sporulation protein PAI 2 n=1 Tax=Usitatibacter palustris TaxID=2732487 RepID=A0A6M4H365_9PROT|nr:FMN-binding negative transcriptional regulator [Usitatibacter palustris]QJR13765.1 Protease synthase and sporulation protein PAI 2 [Usitatibacter palustris]
MYLPKHFDEPRVETIHALIREHPLATLVVRGPDGFEANHVPFLVDPQPGPFGTLRAHVARNNPTWQHLQANPEALVIFSGPQAYISPSAYPSKQEHGRVVPTWNYFAVHAQGSVKVIEDTEWLRKLVTELTDHFEAGRENPWKVTDAPEEFVQNMLAAIVGIEMPVTKFVAKRKASQNRSEADRWGVVEDLRRDGHEAAASLIE